MYRLAGGGGGGGGGLHKRQSKGLPMPGQVQRIKNQELGGRWLASNVWDYKWATSIFCNN